MPGTPGAGLCLNPSYMAPSGAGLGDMTGAYGEGQSLMLIAGAALNVGDSVFLSAANTVTAAVTANNALRIGTVVGGKASRARCYPEVKIGQPAALLAGDYVIVCFSGKVRAVAGAAVAVGDKLGFGAVAGRLITTVAAAGTQFGIALSAAGGAAAELDVLVSLA